MRTTTPRIRSVLSSSVALLLTQTALGRPATGDPPPERGAGTAASQATLRNPGAGQVQRTAWTDPVEQRAYLKASNAEELDHFGWAVAADGDTLVVGAPGEDSAATGVDGDERDNNAFASGAAYVFVRDGAGWSQQAYLKAVEPAAEGFGSAVCVSGDTLAIGTRSESVHVFVREGASWEHEAYLTRSAGKQRAGFGRALSISGDTLAVGAAADDSSATGIDGNPAAGGAPGSGAVHVFVRSGSTWAQQAYVKASNTGTGDLFGIAVAISGDMLAVGASAESSAATGTNGNQGDNSLFASGAVYVFDRSGTSWVQQAYVKPSVVGSNYRFGKAVDLDGNVLAVGAPFDDHAGAAGTVYVFRRLSQIWVEEADLRPANGDSKDGFGASLALSGDQVLVGAADEDSAAVGIDGDPLDDSADGAGAAYLFAKIGPTWWPAAYIKASNAEGDNENGDAFGHAVGLSRNSLVIGACFEDSAAQGVGGDEADNEAGWSGAAYALERTIGSSYCVGATNSLGLSGRIHGRGSRDVDDNDLTLYATNVTPDRPGIFIYGEDQLQVNMGSGYRCVNIIRYVHGPVRTDASGRAVRRLDLDSNPLLATIGSSLPRQWNFQFWYRDSGDANLTDAYAIEFIR